MSGDRRRCLPVFHRLVGVFAMPLHSFFRRAAATCAKDRIDIDVNRSRGPVQANRAKKGVTKG